MRSHARQVEKWEGRGSNNMRLEGGEQEGRSADEITRVWG